MPNHPSEVQTMPTLSEPRTGTFNRTFGQGAAGTVILLGVLVLAGWAMKTPSSPASTPPG